MYLLGLDIGSSSIKAAIVDASTQRTKARVQYPSEEMQITSLKEGWAEQDPALWWDYVQVAIKMAVEKAHISGKDIKSIGIAYQMHGLVLVDKDHNTLRPAIIWCDSRAVPIGAAAYDNLGSAYCSQLLNSPGNFTASKLKWVKDHEPEVFKKIHKVLLPGDFIAMKLTGVCNTTVSGLSEGIFWNFKEHRIADRLLDYYEISPSLLAEQVPSIGLQGALTNQSAEKLNMIPGTPVSYRAGDQVNNAISLGVLEKNQVAATGGTSGVLYGLIDDYPSSEDGRMNAFAHANHKKDAPSIGMLLCINGAGIQYSWIKHQIAEEGMDYGDMENLIKDIPVGSDGLRIVPFGNGAERMFHNAHTGAQIKNIQFNRHTRAHFYRAGLEGIAFSFVYGFRILEQYGLRPKLIRAGNDNLFQSSVFSMTIANLLNISIELIDTSGAVGAAKASGYGAGLYHSLAEALGDLRVDKLYVPDNPNGIYRRAYSAWEKDVLSLMNNS